MLVWFFFFKQKTAYEMRISDWSSDVCSSDLPDVGDLGLGEDGRGGLVVVEVPVLAGVQAHDVLGDLAPLHRRDRRQREATGEVTGDVDVRDVRLEVRSEEHTSELQSLMRISYAVFCLKQKKTTAH